MEHSPFPPEIRASFRDQYVKMGITGQEADTLFDLAENAVNKAFVCRAVLARKRADAA